MKTKIISGKLYHDGEDPNAIRKGCLIITPKGFLKSFEFSQSERCIVFEWTSTVAEAHKFTNKQARNFGEKYSIECFAWNTYKETPPEKGWKVVKTDNGWEPIRTWYQASNEITFLQNHDSLKEVIFEREIDCLAKCIELNKLDMEKLQRFTTDLGIEKNKITGDKFGI